MKKHIYLILSLLCAALIFFLSSQDATTSDTLSKQVTSTVNETAGAGLSNEEMRSIVHFALFLLLGVLTTSWLSTKVATRSITHSKDQEATTKTTKSNVKTVIVALGACVVYAITDELHQGFFVEGRGFELIDLAKDWGGSLCGIAGVAMLRRIRKNRAAY